MDKHKSVDTPHRQEKQEKLTSHRSPNLHRDYHSYATMKNDNSKSSANPSNRRRKDKIEGRANKRLELLAFHRSIRLKVSHRSSLFSDHESSKASVDDQTIVKDLISEAIYNNDAKSLDDLLASSYISSHEKKYYSSDRPWTRNRNPHNILTYVLEYGNDACIDVVLRNVFDGTIYPTIVDHVCSNGKTPLWYACKRGKLEVVRQLIELGHAHVSKCGVLIVASQNGHTDVVEYLLRAGCDPNRPFKNYNETALHAACRRNHLSIVKLLLKHGADTGTLDAFDRTALDYAIHKNHIEIARVLIHHSQGRFSRNRFCFTPVMIAAYFNKMSIVDIFFDVLPREQILEDLALLACRNIIECHGNRRCQAYVFFEKFLSTTSPRCNTIVSSVYEPFRECQTISELAAISHDDHAMRMHALLFSERISVRNNDITNHLRLITQQSCRYRDYGQLHHCLQLKMHGYALANQIKHVNSEDVQWFDKYLSEILTVLRATLSKEANIPVNSMRRIWAWVIERLPHYELETAIIDLIAASTYLEETGKLNYNELKILHNLMRQKTPRIDTGWASTLLPLDQCINAIQNGQLHHQIGTQRVAYLSMIRLLLNAGVDANNDDSENWWTSLHRAVQCDDTELAKSIIILLLDAGAHIDYTNRDNNRPQDEADDEELKTFLLSHGKMSLKCRCADLIKTWNVPHEKFLPLRLVNFVKRHSNLLQPRSDPIRNDYW